MTIQMFRTRALLRALFVTAIAGSAFAEDAPPQVDQTDLNKAVAEGRMTEAFVSAFEAGDKLTEFSFTAEQGVGAAIGEGRRFTRFPRADLAGETEWANHFPKREGGANATSCIACHNAPIANGGGDIALNAVVDPDHSGDPSQYLERNTLPLFALGIPQRLAEEISLELQAQNASAEVSACALGHSHVVLEAKGIEFGSRAITRASAEPCTLTVDDAGLDGIDPDLVVKPFGWKGNHATIRAFTRGAAHNETGMQAVELVGSEDGDFDGVINELTVGDLTALTVYMAALERPVSTVELSDIGMFDLSEDERAKIASGEQRFSEIGCSSCHVPQLALDDPIFREPSTTPGFFDVTFPDGSNPSQRGLEPDLAISFDLTGDQPNNRFTMASGKVAHLGAMETDVDGVAIARWFTDFKRHDMGADLSDPSDPLKLGASMFLTRSLAGVASTGPWLHDGRATSLDEAIVLHGGDALDSSLAYSALPETQQDEIIAFLESLVVYVEQTAGH